MKLKNVLVIILFLASFVILFSSKVNSQIPQGSPSVFDTFVINLSGVDLNSASGLVINLAFVGGTAQLKSGLSFKGTGALLLLNTVDTTNNVLSLAFDGKITDGKASITGMIKPDTIAGNPTINVTKVQASGGTDITSTLSVSVKISNSIAPTPTSTPTPTPSPSPSPSLSPSPSPTPKIKKPTLTLTGPETIVLKKVGLNSIKLKATGTNFTTKNKCQATSSDKLLAQVRPSKFLLSGLKTNILLNVSAYPLSARDLIKSNSSRNISINVNCSNGATAKLDLLLDGSSR